MNCKIFMTIFILLFTFSGKSQTLKEIKKIKSLFKGSWSNTKANRHLIVSFEGNDHYATINDWTGNDRSTADVYKAFIKDDKLVMPKESEEHRAPYCEMIISRNKLLFRCKGLIKEEDQFVDSTYFIKSNKKGQ